MSAASEARSSFLTQRSSTEDSIEVPITLSVTAGEEPWWPIGQTTKYLGKLYIDRHVGERPGRGMILRALKIIAGQAPRKSARVSVQFKASSKLTNPAMLIGEDSDGSLLVRVPLLKVFSVGCNAKQFYYLTASPHTEDINRFWVFAYSCKSRDIAHNLSTAVISMCSLMRKGGSRRTSRLSATTPQSSLGAGVQWSPTSLKTVGSVESSPDATGSASRQSTFNSSINKLVADVRAASEVRRHTQSRKPAASVKERPVPSPELMYDYTIPGVHDVGFSGQTVTSKAGYHTSLPESSII